MADHWTYASLLQLVLEDGADDATGDPIYEKKSFVHVKPDSTTDQLYAAAQAFAGLQVLPLHTINRQDSSKIRNQ